MEPVYVLAKAILKPWLATWFRWGIEGAENIPREGPAILAFNHISYLDPLAAAYVVDSRGRRARFIAKSELFTDRRIGWLFRGAHQIEVKRGTRHAPVALDQAVDALHRGEIVVVFPEGTITTNSDLSPMPLKRGAARLAIQSGAPLIPCAIWGSANFWVSGYTKRWWPRQDVLMRIGSPIETSGMTPTPAGFRRLSEDTGERISALVASLRPALPDYRRPLKGRAA